jgi:hypothetical protein
MLMPYSNVTVFFGHIHQTLHQNTGHIQHHAARSLMFAFPPRKPRAIATRSPGSPITRSKASVTARSKSAPSRTTTPSRSSRSMGARREPARDQRDAVRGRSVRRWRLGLGARCGDGRCRGDPTASEPLDLRAATITLQKDVPVILEINSSDVHHGFNVPDLGLRADARTRHACACDTEQDRHVSLSLRLLLRLRSRRHDR